MKWSNSSTMDCCLEKDLDMMSFSHNEVNFEVDLNIIFTKTPQMFIKYVSEQFG